MRRDERVTVQGPVKEQQPDGMSHGGRAKDFWNEKPPAPRQHAVAHTLWHGAPPEQGPRFKWGKGGRVGGGRGVPPQPLWSASALQPFSNRPTVTPEALPQPPITDLHNPSGNHPFGPRRNSGLLHVCTSGSQHKAQKENASSVAQQTAGTFLSQTRDPTMPVAGTPTVAKQ